MAGAWCALQPAACMKIHADTQGENSPLTRALRAPARTGRRCFRMSTMSSTPSASTNSALFDALISVQHSASNRFSTYSASASVPAGRFLYGAIA